MKVLEVVRSVQLLVEVLLDVGWEVQQKVGPQVLRSVVTLVVHHRVLHGVDRVLLVMHTVMQGLQAVSIVKLTNRQSRRAMVVHWQMIVKEAWYLFKADPGVWRVNDPGVQPRM